MTFLERIDYLIAQKGINRNTVAKDVDGITHGSFYTWEKRGNIPSGDIVARLAEYLDTTSDYLLCKTDNPSPLPSGAIPVGAMCVLPVLGSVSAGNGVVAYEDIEGFESADEKYGNDNHFYLRVKGDSMSPFLQDGDLALIRKQTSVDSGDLAVVIVDNEEGLIKKVCYDKEWIELHSINPHYPVRRFDGQDVLRVYVAGLVLESKRKIK